MKVREGMAIIADIATLVGVSALGVFSPTLVQTFLGRPFSLIDLSSSLLFYAIIIFFFAAPTVVATRSFVRFGRVLWEGLKKRSSDGHVLRISRAIYLEFGTYLLFLTVYFWFFPQAKALWANLFNSRYLFPAAPSVVVKDVTYKFDVKQNELLGNVLFTDPSKVNIEDYRIAVYTGNTDVSGFNLLKSGSNAAFSLQTDGSFSIGEVSSYGVEARNELKFIVCVINSYDVYFRTYIPVTVRSSKSIALHEVQPFIAGD